MNAAAPEAVPQQLRERFDAVMEVVDPFCLDHLNEEYAF